MFVYARYAVVDPNICSNFVETLVIMIYKFHIIELWSNPF